MEKQYKPQKNAFLFFKLALKAPIVTIPFIALKITAWSFVSFYYIFPFLILSLLVLYYYELVVYRKLNFYFFEDKIIQKGGSIFSDYETELHIKNITQIRYRLPFVENKLFKTGHIDIESAGSRSSEIHLCSMANHPEIYKLVKELLTNNGFNISEDELVLEETPNSLGVFFEVFRGFFAFIFFILILYIQLFSELADTDYNVENNFLLLIFSALAVFVIFLFFIFQIFNFFDLKRRVYRVYKNVITYREGFLSKNYSMIPFRNIADSMVTQTFVDKIFHLYDVRLSSQGVGNEIAFRNIANGKRMSDVIDDLINKSNEEEKDDSFDLKNELASSYSTKEVVEKNPLNNLKYNTSYTNDLSIDFNRTVLLPSIIAGISILTVFILLLIPFKGEILALSKIAFSMALILSVSFFSFSAIYSFVIYRNTKYRIGEKSVRYNFDFFVTREKEFSAEKVTAIKIKRSFIDDWFNTITVEFWSIGSDSSIIFSSIKKEDGLIANIMSKFAINNEEKILNISPRFILFEYVKSFLPQFILGIILLIPFYVFTQIIVGVLVVPLMLVLLAIFIINFLYNREYYKRTQLILCKNFVYYQEGWFFKDFYYSKYDDIKDIETIKYPFSKEGKIHFNISGERLIRTGKQSVVKSNTFTADFIDDIRHMHKVIDYVFYKNPSKEDFDQEKHIEEIEKLDDIEFKFKPSLKNTFFNLSFVILVPTIFILAIGLMTGPLFPFIAIGIVIFNIIIILVVTLPVIMTTYYIEKYRVVKRSGVIFKKQKSIIYSKIDFMNSQEGFLNKIFKNGTISINTVGSSKTELLLTDVPEYKKLYEEIKKRY